MTRTVLITGGAGFIGANFVHYWLREHASDRLIVLDALTYAGNLASLEPALGAKQIEFIRGDVCDARLINSIFTEQRPQVVVHFAAESHVDRSITGPDEFIRTNVVGTHTLLKAALASWRSPTGSYASQVRFHHISTDEVYGSLGPSDAKFNEATGYAPNSPYSASKAASDHLVRAYHHTYGLPVTTTNCSNNYGPYQFPEKLIPLMLLNALHGKPLPVYGRGENIRDWLYVEDHCRAIDLCLARGKTGETYNIGGNNEWRNIDIVKLLCRELERRFANDRELTKTFPHCPVVQGRNLESLIAFVTDRPGHDFRYAIDSSKAQRELGFAARETFETGIAKTIDWYLRNAAWRQTLVQRHAPHV